MLKVLAALVFSLAPSMAMAASTCPVPPPVEADGIRYFLAIEPSDSPLDVWCRIQALKGDVRVNLWFTGIGANKTFPMHFDGTAKYSKDDFARMLQSTLPIGTGAKYQDENGQDFSKVLKHVYQPIVPSTDDEQSMGLPPEIAAAHEPYLWEPFAIRVRPLKLAGADFILTVRFRPRVWRMLQGMNGTAEAMSLFGATERVLPGAVKSGDIAQCPPNFPQCVKFLDKETTEIKTAWTVEAVILDADGGRLSPTAESVLTMIAAENSQWVTNNTMKEFVVADGVGEVEANDEARQVIAKSKADPNHSLGSEKIRVAWSERNSKKAFTAQMIDWANKYRDALVTQYSRR